MKKILSLLIILVSYASCSEKPEPAITDAKSTVDEIFVESQKLSKNEMTQTDYDKVALPLYKKLDSLKLILNSDEKQQLENYAEQRFDETFPEGVKN